MLIRSFLIKYIVLLAIGLLALSTASYADTDPRMVVEVGADKQGHVPAVQEAIQLALPILWDRVVEDSFRSSVSDSMRATTFLLRVVPQSDHVEVTFNQDRIWQYLDSKEIAYLKEPLRLNLQIQMTNSSDNTMPKTAEALLGYAQGVAKARGIVLDSRAPLLQANWRWLDAAQVHLSVDGDSLLSGYTETRSMTAGDPLEQLQSWVEALLMKARSTYITNVTTPVEATIEQPTDATMVLLLTMDLPATLATQVVFEDSLRQNSHVKLLVPTFLSANSRQYRMVLHTADDGWIAEWFRRRGMQATATVDGWLVQ